VVAVSLVVVGSDRTGQEYARNILICIWTTSNKSERLMHLVGWFIWKYFCSLSRHSIKWRKNFKINPLNAKLNLICYLLAVLGAHPILRVSRIRVKQNHLLQYPYKLIYKHNINYAVENPHKTHKVSIFKCTKVIIFICTSECSPCSMPFEIYSS
jgi:hypothetical protein